MSYKYTLEEPEVISAVPAETRQEKRKGNKSPEILETTSGSSIHGNDDDDDDDGTSALPILYREDSDESLSASFYSAMARVSPTQNAVQASSASVGRRSLHYVDKAAVADSSFDSNQELSFMKKIKRRECMCFIEESSQETAASEDDKLCGCGYTKSQHMREHRELSIPGVTWEYGLHTKTFPTDAFGEIEFVGFGDKVAKYVRVDVDTKMESMLKLLQSAWGLEKPNLLISVTGGAKNFTMKARLREAFRRGLMKAALSTGAWIVTGGTNAGVMKHVGEAVRDFGLTSEGRVIAIGIASWGCIQSKDQLISADCQGKWPAPYRIDSKEKAKESFLDPNHSHFILVDNGTQHKFTVEIPFRAKLEETIAAQKTDTGADAVTVPVCLLVLEGGPGTLQTVHLALSSRTPTVVIKGSGKTADILAYAYQNAREDHTTAYDHQSGNEVKETTFVLDPHVISDIREMIKTHFGEALLDMRVDWVKECCSKRDLLSVFELDSKNSAKDVDLAVLKALLKANKNVVMDQLKFALAWNRIDMAKSEIFTDDRRWRSGMLDEVMMSAIQLNRVDFVDLFLDHGVFLKDFVTVERLLKLYNNIPKNCLLYTLLRKSVKRHSDILGRHGNNRSDRQFTLSDVGHLIQDLLGDYYQPLYLQQQNINDSNEKVNAPDLTSTLIAGNDAAQVMTQFAAPAQELFIWAVLMNNHKLSKLFWEEGRESSTAAALFASSILNSMKEKTLDVEIRRKLQASAEDYAQLAIGVINKCYSSDEKRTHDLLTHVMPHWGESTCVLLAVQSNNKEFIAQTACQSLLNSMWMGRMAQGNSLFWIIPSIILFPLIQIVIKFVEVGPRKGKEVTAIDTTSSEKKDKPKGKELDLALTRESSNNHHILARQQTVLNLDANLARKKSKGCSVFKKHSLFYRTPLVKFIVNVIAYFTFLLLYSYYLVVQLSREFHPLEAVLIIWVFSIFLEEIREFLTGYAVSFKSKVTAYFSDTWNILDVTTIFLFVLGMILRFIDDDEFLSAARVILSINLITFFFRILHIFSAHKQLGPKLVMINRMIQDLMSFVIILIVFIVTYAISSEAVLYPNSELSWKLLYYLPRKAYWHIYGELFLDVIEGTIDNCTNDPEEYRDYEQQRCPSPVGKYYVPILLGVYILMTNVLLLNLLIAMFSYTFEQVQENTDMHWCFQRFSLVYEYTHRPVLPPPFIILSHIATLVTKFCPALQWGSEMNEFRKQFTKLQEKQLMQWENVIADTFLSSTEKAERNTVAGRVKYSMERLEVVLTKVDELQDNINPASAASATNQIVPVEPGMVKLQPDLEKRMEVLENQMVHTVKALEWIMLSLQENNMAAKEAKPILPDINKQKDEAKERKRRKRQVREEKEKKMIQDILDKKIMIHFMSRSSPYPGSKIMRFPVSDEKVLWEIDYPEYNPPIFTSVDVLGNSNTAAAAATGGTDEDLMAMRPEVRSQSMQFNTEDKKWQVSRVSLYKKYKVIDGLPINPMGRTGLRGRGSLNRWGPNHTGDPVVTRWKMREGSIVQEGGKPVLEFVAVQRPDTKKWAIPGAACKSGEVILNILKSEYKLDTVRPTHEDPAQRKKVQDYFDELAKNGEEVYKGYADDPRNTDNAWMETRVVNYHDQSGAILQHQHLRAADDDVNVISWQTVSSSLPLHGAQSTFLKLIADRHKAAF